MWKSHLAATLLLLLVYYLLPSEGAGKAIIYVGVTVLCATAILLGVALNRPARPRPWYLLAAGMGLYALADVFWVTATTFPSLADLLFVLAYLTLLAGLIALAQDLARSSEWLSWIDALIVTASVTIPAWIVLIQPNLEDTSLSLLARMVAVSYTILDLFLLAVLLRLIFVGSARLPALSFLVIGVVGQLFSDIAYGRAVLGGSYHLGMALDTGWFLMWAFLGAAALHESMRSLSFAVPIGKGSVFPRRRLAAVALSAMVPPAVMLSESLNGMLEHLGMLAIISALLFLLVLARIAGMVLEAEGAKAQLEEFDRELQEKSVALGVASREADRANLAKSEFLSRMSHEPRTPLNSVLGFAQVLQMDQLNEDQRDGLEQIESAGRHLLELVNEVLDITGIESGAVTLSIEPVTLDHLLPEIVDLVRPLSGARGIRLKVQEGDALGGTEVLADRQKLKQVVLNQLANAIKYSRDYSRVGLSYAPVGASQIRVVVTDEGDGIPPDRLERLFTPFDRLGAESSAVEGTGLGLPLSKGFVEAMGGSIEVDSCPGRGSTFSFTLPAAPAVAESVAR